MCFSLVGEITLERLRHPAWEQTARQSKFYLFFFFLRSLVFLLSFVGGRGHNWFASVVLYENFTLEFSKCQKDWHSKPTERKALGSCGVLCKMERKWLSALAWKAITSSIQMKHCLHGASLTSLRETQHGFIISCCLCNTADYLLKTERGEEVGPDDLICPQNTNCIIEALYTHCVLISVV